MTDGFEQLDAALAAFGFALSGAQLQACTQAAAAPILAQAQQRVHVRRGDVLNRLGTVSHHSATSATTAVQVADSGPGGAAHEAIFLEYGTSKSAAMPFMRPALVAAQDAAIPAFTAAFQTNLKDT